MTKFALDLSAYDLAPGEFARRAAWAKSQGRDTWLWPDITVHAWRQGRATVTKALSEVLRHGSAETPLTGDPDVLSLAAFTAGLGPLLGWWIAEGRVAASDEIAAVMDLHLRQNRRRMERMRERAEGIVQALAAKSVTVTMLKGMHTAFAYFPDPATRPLSDIDLLIDPAEADRANAHFRDSGYELNFSTFREDTWSVPGSSPEPRSLMLAHADDPWTIDLHRSLNYAPVRPSARRGRIDFVSEPRARQAWPAEAAALVLPQPLLLLHLATHASCPLGSLTPLRMAEVVMVIRRDTALGTLQWPVFLSMARKAGALGIVFPMLHFAEALAPGTVPGEVLEASAAVAPLGVRNAIAPLSAADAQQIVRVSLKEHFMWCEGWRDVLHCLAADLVPTASPGALWAAYRRRATRVLRGRLRYGLTG
jgi:hypothetical protein